jgi:hypothetical protein
VTVRRTLGVLALLHLLGLLSGCATARPDTSRLEAAIERFERAAEQAEAAAAQAEASARQAEMAAQAVASGSPSGPHPTDLALRRTERHRQCTDEGRGPVRNASEAARIAQAFLRCLELSWGEPVEIVRIPSTGDGPDRYRVHYETIAEGSQGIVLVAIDSGRADFPGSGPP